MLTVEIDGQHVTVNSDPKVVAEIKNDEKSLKSLLSIIRSSFTSSSNCENEEFTVEGGAVQQTIHDPLADEDVQLDDTETTLDFKETSPDSVSELHITLGNYWNKSGSRRKKLFVKSRKKSPVETHPLDKIKYNLKTDPRFLELIKNLSLSFEEKGSEYYISTNNYDKVLGIMRDFGMAFAVRDSSFQPKLKGKKPRDAELSRRILWSSASVAYFGMPFKIKKTMNLQCCNGPTYYHTKLTPETRKRKRTKPSKKGDCAATMKVLLVSVYPKYALDVNNTVNVNDRKKAKMKQLRDASQISDVLTEDRYFIWFSKPEVHSHSVWATCSTESLTTLLSQQGFNNIAVVSNLKAEDCCNEELSSFPDTLPNVDSLETSEPEGRTSVTSTEERVGERSAESCVLNGQDSAILDKCAEVHNPKPEISVAGVEDIASRILNLCSLLPHNCNVAAIYRNLKLAESKMLRILENSIIDTSKQRIQKSTKASHETVVQTVRTRKKSRNLSSGLQNMQEAAEVSIKEEPIDQVNCDRLPNGEMKQADDDSSQHVPRQEVRPTNKREMEEREPGTKRLSSDHVPIESKFLRGKLDTRKSREVKSITALKSSKEKSEKRIRDKLIASNEKLANSFQGEIATIDLSD